MHRKLRRVLTGKAWYCKLIDRLRQRWLISKYLIPELNHSPRVMVRGDLASSNIVVDHDYDISGSRKFFLPDLSLKLIAIYRVFDYGFAEYLLLQFAAVSPRILDHGTWQDQDDIDVAPELPDESQSLLVWRSKNTETKRRDRQLFLDETESLCKTCEETCDPFHHILSAKERDQILLVVHSNQQSDVASNHD